MLRCSRVFPAHPLVEHRPRWVDRIQPAGRLSLLAAAALLFAASTARPLPLGALLSAPLENRFSRAVLVDASGYVGVMALGGGVNRIREAADLARRWPHLKLLVTGAGTEERVRGWVGEDIGEQRVLVETAARNTFENAALALSIVKRQAPGLEQQRWLLVTSASHMPRAVGAFRKAGLAVEPWPIYDLDELSRHRMAAARHEWLGLVWYRLLGRSSDLFPAPTDRDAG